MIVIITIQFIIQNLKDLFACYMLFIIFLFKKCSIVVNKHDYLSYILYRSLEGYLWI